LTRDLQQGSTGADVMALQKFLNSDAATMVAASGAGSPGNETSTFGPATKAAAIKLQTKWNVTPAAGYVGAKTRAAIASVCGGSNPSVPSGPGLSVSASAQPANAIAPASASRVPFTTFMVTNNSGVVQTINSVTVQRTGFANDAAFSGIVLLDQTGMQIGVSSTFNSNHQANIGTPFTINPGETKTLTIAGNMASNLTSYSGQIASIQVVAVNSTAAVNGSLPITGASHTLNSTLAIGTAVVSISSFDPNNASSRNIGDTSINFSGVRIQAGSAEDVKLMSIRWRLNGSVSASDLGNLMTYVNGTSYPAMLSSDGRYITSTFAGGVLIAKGISADVYVRGDITGANASGRIAEFDIDKAADIYVVGQTYGYGIVPTAASTNALSSASTHGSTFSTSQPFFQGSTVSIQGGTVTTITNATSVASQNIAVNVPNQVLGGFQTNFLGEPVTVQTLVINVATTSNTATNLTNVSIVDSNGAVVAGPVDSVYVSSGVSSLTFNNSITFPVGSKVYTLKGTVPTTAANGDTYRLSTTPSSQWTGVTGQTTGNTVSLSSAGLVQMNTMTVRGATLSVSLSATPAAQSIVAGGQNVVFANVQLDASQSGEDVRLNALPLSLGTNGTSPATSAGNTTTNLTACQLWNGAVGSGSALNYGSFIVNTPTVAATSSGTAVTSTSNSNNFSFNNALVVTKGTVVTLTLTCNVAAGATGAYGWNVVNGVSITATGNTSNTTLGSSALTVTTTAAGAQTIGNGSFTAAVDTATTPSRAIVAGGSTGVTIGSVKFRASNESVSLTKVGLSLSGGVYGSASTAAGQSTNSGVGDVVKAYIYDGANKVGEVTFTGTTATSTLTAPVTLTQNIDKILTIKADLQNVGIGQSGGIGDVVAIKPVSAEGVGLSSGSTLAIGATGSVNGAQLFKSYPTLAAVSGAAAGIAGQNVTLKRFTVTSNAAGSIGINKITISVATSSANATNLRLYAYTDAGYSAGVSNQGSGTGLVDTECATGCASNNPSLAFDASSPIQVSGTVYFALIGDVTQTGSNSNGTVFATVKGDATDPGVGPSPAYIATTTAAAGLVSSNFVWSGNSSTTAATTNNDWWNGYFVAGLPSTGI
jgi:hypothetical protein